MQTPSEGFKRILEVLDLLEIPYMVAGSTASSIHGIARPTLDIDFVVSLDPDQVEDLAQQLRADFYADAQMMKDALVRGRSFNLIHYATSYKFDMFPLQKDEYNRTQFGRRQFEKAKVLDENIECAFATAEDTILNKLRWYRAGGETSERQWNDLRGIRQVQGNRLDLNYLNDWAPRLGVADLLARLLRESPPKRD